jgi:hypothetical protein
MSQFANFDSPSSKPNPFAATPAFQQPPKRSNAWLWILLGVGGTMLVVCCGCVGLFALGYSQMGKPLMAQLNADPTAQQHLGTVTKAEFDFVASTQATEKAKGAGGGNVMVFNVEGDKGKGVVQAKQAPAGTLHDAVLVLPSGEQVDLGF